MKKAITDIETGITEIVDLTEQEIAQVEIRQAELLEFKQVEAQKAADKAALLEKLGINDDEAKLLLS
jgi:hypothetical protein